LFAAMARSGSFAAADSPVTRSRARAARQQGGRAAGPAPASPAKPEAPKQSLWKKMLTRSIVGVAMILFFLWIISSAYVMVILPTLLVLLQTFVFKEVVSVRYNDVKEKRLFLFRTLNWMFFGTTMVYFHAKHVLRAIFKLGFMQEETFALSLRYHLWVSFTLFVIGFVTWICTLKQGLLKFQFTQLAWTMLSLMLVVFQTACVMSTLQEGLFWVVFPASMIICNDISAYFWGVFLGRKIIDAPFVKLSPNKTWEGFLGAAATTLAFSIPMCSYALEHRWFVCPAEYADSLSDCILPTAWTIQEWDLPDLAINVLRYLGHDQQTVWFAPVYMHGLILAAFASLIAPFGGFFASGMKRAHGIKDFDSIFPGHGGFYDRFDCQLIMGLCTYVHYVTFIRTSAMSLGAVYNMVDQLSVADKQLLLRHLQSTIG